MGRAIETSPNGLIYAKSFYLDNICAGWNALTGENYEWVLPLTDKKKFGISYLYQPPFTQQLGVFAKRKVFLFLSGKILHWLKQQYRFWKINWKIYENKPEFDVLPVRHNCGNEFCS